MLQGGLPHRPLKKVHIPTWIERAIPVLGKASFGRLKADEWRNLFTVQLPLILPLLWTASKALLHNFEHLVSLVNLALKRSINNERINKYRSHLSKYMESSLILFPDSPVAPNHHMAFHLADCLDSFGPCRAWWSFSMERLMGQILKSTSNNHVGNLRALLQISALSDPALAPYIRQVKALYDPIPFVAKHTRPTSSLEEVVFQELIARINQLFPLEQVTWISSDRWAKLSSRNAAKFAQLQSRVTQLRNLTINNVLFSTMETNENNCVVALKTNRNANYGIIENIFKHSQVSPQKVVTTNTWLTVTPLVPVAPAEDTLKGLYAYDMGLALRRIDRSTRLVFHMESTPLAQDFCRVTPTS
ncbi:hypothetical protein VP01_2964g6 [Puccinia sorghi]|uniref:Uncharacterized protein n=1 Tax=Puccinia sorghi TaxID=27349 RepID=A0A0L6V1K9_9BASI|nr:hypothetical protein VP01_2964g6 [Puccinia sorghi]